jgi:hypothetical protein
LNEIEIALAIENCRDFIRRWDEQQRGLAVLDAGIQDLDIATTLRRLRELMSVSPRGQAIEIERLIHVTELRLNSTDWRKPR